MLLCRPLPLLLNWPKLLVLRQSLQLKPDKLVHDASMANYRTWMKQFRAYFDAGLLNTLACTQQQAYLNNCLDDVLCV